MNKQTHVLRKQMWSPILLGLFFITLISVSIWTASNGIGDWNLRTLKRDWYKVGELSLLLTALSVSPWLIRKIIKKAHRRLTHSSNWLNGAIMLFLRKNHMLLGWLAFLLGIGHSIFFLINLPERESYLYSGIAALVSMFILSGIGLLYKFKSINIKFARRWHLIFALIFIIILIVHV